MTTKTLMENIKQIVLQAINNADIDAKIEEADKKHLAVYLELGILRELLKDATPNLQQPDPRFNMVMPSGRGVGPDRFFSQQNNFAPSFGYPSAPAFSLFQPESITEEHNVFMSLLESLDCTTVAGYRVTNPALGFVAGDSVDDCHSLIKLYAD